MRGSVGQTVIPESPCLPGLSLASEVAQRYKGEPLGGVGIQLTMVDLVFRRVNSKCAQLEATGCLVIDRFIRVCICYDSTPAAVIVSCPHGLTEWSPRNRTEQTRDSSR